MKFHCDRCKTKYSISDDRVRGKILKIRCKNCSAVITVRESPEASASSATSTEARADAGAAKRAGSASGQEALAGAFKAAVSGGAPADVTGSGAAPAPVSLDAEWYLSKDGQQEGPFDLEAARSWVRSKEASDELYVWSEGYDDWLAIEKVSHFRGVRRGAIPSVEEGDEPTMIQSGEFGFLEETPKPLFAATMAAVSAGNPDTISEEMPHVVSPKASGAAVFTRPAPLPSPSYGGPAIPSAARAPSIPLAARAPAIPQSARAPSIPLAARAPQVSNNGAAAAGKDAGASLEFDIGEASRVVDLPTLMAQRGNARSLTPGGNALPGMDTSLGRGSGAAPALSNTGPLGSLPGSDLAQPFVPSVPTKKRRGVLIPLLGAGAVIAAVAGLLIYFMSDTDTEKSVARGSVGGSGNLAYSFGDNGKRLQPSNGDKTLVEAAVEDDSTKPIDKGKRPVTPKNNPVNNVVKNNQVRDPDEVDLSGSGSKGPTGPLDGDDLMQVYGKNSIAIKMCYERSLKKNPLLKVPKTIVDIQVGLDGRVSSVKIPSMAGTELGSCIISRIERWKFRTTTEVFSSRFPLVFDR